MSRRSAAFASPASLVLLSFAVRESVLTPSAVEQCAWLCLASVAIFGIYASIQFIRGKSAKLLILALTLGVVVDVMTLIALPIVRTNFEDQRQDHHRARGPKTRTTRA